MASSSTNSSPKRSRTGPAKPELEKLLAKPLPVSFYERDTLVVARELLGKVLIVRPNGLTAGRIIETEAYQGADPASHSCRGKTPRCEVMFGRGGVAYVYFIYGMYEMLNFVTEAEGSAGAVLIRAIEPVAGLELMAKRRKFPKRSKSGTELTAGPGKLCNAMGIEMRHNGQGLQGPELFVSDDGYRPEGISVSPRVGIRVATEKPWRFFVTGNEFVSRAPQNKQARPW